eukprot:CCRYP_020252-RB/>CCRYP_020252-RB protein AED:0.47 eAED:1.00 QI:0/0/0/1/0/0/2/0/143
MPMFESSNNFSITCLQLLLWYLLQIDPCCFELGKGLLSLFCFLDLQLTNKGRHRKHDRTILLFKYSGCLQTWAVHSVTANNKTLAPSNEKSLSKSSLFASLNKQTSQVPHHFPKLGTSSKSPSTHSSDRHPPSYKSPAMHPST